MYIEEQAVRVSFRATEITASVLLGVMRAVVGHHQGIQHGEQSLAKLNQQNRELSSMPLTKQDAQALRRELHRYGVDFSVFRDPRSSPDLYQIYFKSQDIQRVHKGIGNCLKDFSQDTIQKRPVKEVVEEAARESEARAAAGREEGRETRSEERPQGGRDSR